PCRLRVSSKSPYPWPRPAATELAITFTSRVRCALAWPTARALKSGCSNASDIVQEWNWHLRPNMRWGPAMRRSTSGFEDDPGTTPDQPPAREGRGFAAALALAYLGRFWVAELDHDDHGLFAWLFPYMAPAVFVFVAIKLYRRDEPNGHGTTVGGMML